MSRCHGDAADDHASLRTTGPQTNRRADIRQRITASSSRSAANTKRKPQDAWTISPATNGGGRGVRWARIMLRLRSADREPANPFLTQAQCDGTQAPSLVMLYVQNSRDKARRGDIPRLARHAEMMVAVYAKLLDPSFVSLSSFFLVFEVVDGRGRDAMAQTERCTEFLAIHYTWDHAGDSTAVACV